MKDPIESLLRMFSGKVFHLRGAKTEKNRSPQEPDDFGSRMTISAFLAEWRQNELDYKIQNDH